MKDVCIKITSTQSVEDTGDKDTTELFTYGSMEPIKNGFRLGYDESETTGFQGSHVTLEVFSDRVTMQRKGKAVSSLIIERGKKHHCHYGTEYGDFMIGISTNEIRSCLTDKGGDIYLKYTLDINSSYMSENEMFINVTECGAPNA